MAFARRNIGYAGSNRNNAASNKAAGS